MHEPKASDGRFSFVARAKSFTNAGRGIWVFLKTTPNAWIQISFFLIAIGFGLYFEIERFDWMLLVLAAGFVVAAEAFNTAIEIDIDLTSPEYHPYARDTKDVAAGAVFISAVTAFVIGVFIFLPHLISD